jgi:hypothetical protein
VTAILYDVDHKPQKCRWVQFGRYSEWSSNDSFL